METFGVILLIVVIVFLLAILFTWIYEHRCSICGNIHIDKEELRKCIKCGKLFCRDKSTQHEVVRSYVKGMLGSGISAEVQNKREHYGDSCGYIYIETNSQGSTISSYCYIHDPRRIKKKKKK